MKSFLAVVLIFGLLSLNAHSQAQAHFKKVVYIVFENEDFVPVSKQRDFAKYSALGASFSLMMGETHPSQGNYIAMVAGSTLGVMTDKNYNLNQTHLGDLLEAKGMDWKVYAEGYPGNCYTGEVSGNYARKHLPFLSFLNVTTNPERCGKITDAATFIEDFKNDKLPEFSMFIPDLINDGHDSTVDYAGKWLTRTLGPILSEPDKMKDVLFVLTFDESDPKSRPNQIYTVFLGANVVKASVISQKVNHISILKMIEDEFGLGSMGRLDSTAAPIENIWNN